MKRSFFDMSHDRKLTCAFNDLIPIFMEDTLPGDTFSCTTSIFIRLAPQLNPVMADLRVHVEFFFIPNRLLWRVSNSTTPNLFPNDTRDDYRLQTRWEDFITGFQSYDSAESAGYPDDRDPYPPKAVVTRPPLLNFSPLPYYGERKPLAGSLYDYLYNIPPTYYNKDRPGDEISARHTLQQ
ncbi:hypothetical protein FACS189467_9000 [Bacteroidia bacterium]|nr:hypothetical protein FACS189467_9000 [Bacteroidia bacterium]